MAVMDSVLNVNESQSSKRQWERNRVWYTEDVPGLYT